MLTARKVQGIILISFLLSGMAGLIYEVLWVRQLGLVFGTTLYSVSTTLAAFMAGLALGSLLFGRLADRTANPIRLFALLEVGVGLYAFIMPFIINRLMTVQVFAFQNLPEGHFSLILIRVVLCFLVLLLPTTLMGGTLPVIAKFFVRRERELGSWVGALYFINTMGAVLGSFLAGFILIPFIGVLAATYMAASLDLAIGIGFLILQRRLDRKGELQVMEEATATRPLAEKSRKTRGRREVQEAAPYSNVLRTAVLVGFGLAGLASLSLEVSWTRVLTMVLGSSVYSFSLMLTAFLLGIALGSLTAARFIGRSKNLWRDFVMIEAFIGISIIVLNPLLGQLPLLFARAFSGFEQNFWVLQIVLFLLSFVIMLIPTLLMGAAFPIAARIYTQDIRSLGRSLGTLYAGNAFGSVAGPLLTRFFIIPLVGIQGSISLVALIYLAIAGTVFMLGPFHRTAVKGIAAGAVVAIAVVSFLLPAWDKGILTSGVYLYTRNYIGGEDSNLRDSLTKNIHLLFYKEGLQATVSVIDQMDGNRLLNIDGKVDASNYADLSTELLLGHLPMLLHPEPRRVLMVGFGSGITLGAIEQHPLLEKVEAVEIEPTVVEAASYFAEANHDALNHPKLKMVVTDARNYVLASGEQYDIITAEPSNPWISGSSVLFAREQFELYRNRLSEDGIVCQWIQYYSMSTQDLKTLINTFRSVFPNATLWGRDVDLLLIGSLRPFSIDFQALAARLQEGKVQADLQRIDIEDAYEIIGYLLMDEQSLSSYSADAPLHTDNHPILEFSTPRNLYKYGVGTNLESMRPYLVNSYGDLYKLLANVDDPEGESKIQSYINFREHFHRAMVYNEQDNPMEAINEYEAALALGIKSAPIHRILGAAYGKLGQELVAIAHLETAIALSPSYVPSYVELAMTYFSTERSYEDALALYDKAIELVSGNTFLYFGRGYARQKLGNYDQAIADYNNAIKLYPGYTLAQAYRDLCYQEIGYPRTSR